MPRRSPPELPRPPVGKLETVEHRLRLGAHRLGRIQAAEETLSSM